MSTDQYAGWLNSQPLTSGPPLSDRPPLGSSRASARSDGGSTARSSRQATSVMEELEQEMKLLHWHKLANEAALKAALIRTKRLKARDNKVVIQTARQQERALWIQKVLEEEQQRPLEVTDDWVRSYEEKEAREEARLEKEVDRHIRQLTRLRSGLKKREEEKVRHARYKARKRALGPLPTKLEDFAEGKLLAGSRANTPGSRRGPMTPFSDARTATPLGDEEVDAREAAPTVLQSLNKLVELEERIANLEDAPGYTPVGPGTGTPRSRGGMPTGTAVLFTKKRQATRTNAPARTVFAVKVVDKSMVPSKRLGRDGVRSFGASRRPTVSAISRGGPTTGASRSRARARRPGASRQQGAVVHSWLAQKKAKQEERRKRIAANNARNARRSGGNNWVRDRDGTRRAGSRPRAGAGAGAGAGTGAGGGARSSSYGGGARPRRAAPGHGGRHMAAFHDMRKEFEHRKSAMRYGDRRERGVKPGVRSRVSSRTIHGGRGVARRSGAGRGRSTSTGRSPSTRLTRTTRPSRSSSTGRYSRGASPASSRSFQSSVSSGSRSRSRPAWGSGGGSGPVSRGSRLTPAQRRARGTAAAKRGRASRLGVAGRSVR